MSASFLLHHFSKMKEKKMSQEENNFSDLMIPDEYGVINLVFVKLDRGSLLDANGKRVSLSHDAEIVACVNAAAAKAQEDLLTLLGGSKIQLERVTLSIGVRVDADNDMTNQRDSIYANIGEEELRSAVNLWRNVQGNLANKRSGGYFERDPLQPSPQSGTRVLGDSNDINSKGKEITHNQSRNDKGDKSRHFDKSGPAQSGTRELG